MKKILSLLCVCLIAVLGFAGCAPKKSAEAFLKGQDTFVGDYSETLDTTKSLFTEEFRDAYSLAYPKQSLLFSDNLIQTSNMTMSRLKVYLENESTMKKMSDGDVKKLNNLAGKYYAAFRLFEIEKGRLESNVAESGVISKQDFEGFNKLITNVILTGCDASGQIIEIVKKVNPTTISSNQSSVAVGSLEILVLETANNIVENYTKIALDEFRLEGLDNYLGITNIHQILSSISSTAGTKFDLTPEAFVSVRNMLLVLQNNNDVLKANEKALDNTLSKFDYASFKFDMQKSFPNDALSASLVSQYVESDKISSTTKAQYNFIKNLSNTTINPCITVLADLLEIINA